MANINFQYELHQVLTVTASGLQGPVRGRVQFLLQGFVPPWPVVLQYQLKIGTSLVWLDESALNPGDEIEFESE